MRTKTKILTGCILALVVVAIVLTTSKNEVDLAVTHSKGCVFMTTFGEESSVGYAKYKLKKAVKPSVDRGLSWLAKAQLNNGGYGAGSHSRQGEMNPHAVNADPATTAMVAMALLRSGTTLNSGDYQNE